MNPFPMVRHGTQTFEFFAAPFRLPSPAFAALVFAWTDDERVVLADIVGRGWCIPSGRVEEGERSSDTARREAIEEAGAVLGTLYPLGHYRIVEGEDVRWADVFVADVVGFTPIGMPEESGGRWLATLEELPGIYYLWNELMARVFAYSQEAFGRTR